MAVLRSYAYGQRPPEIGERAFGLGWLNGIRRISSLTAKASHWHSHPECTVLFCLRGEFSYEFKDRPPITLTAGSCIAFPSGVVHRHALAIDPIGLRLELLINDRPMRNPRYRIAPSQATRECLKYILDRALVPRACPKSVMSALWGLEALAECGEAKLGAMEKAQARLLASTVLLGMSSAAVTAPGAVTPEPMPMETITQWIEAHLAEKLDTARIVAHAGYSRTHVFTLFRKHTGLTPMDYLTRQRIKTAQRLLRTTAMTSREIASACGFSSPAHFGSVFKRQTGMTPLAWREQKPSSN